MGATATDTGGSIRQPAAVTGTVGIKPTYGRCSRWGIVAFASSLDQAGPIARTVRDAAILLEVDGEQRSQGHHQRRPAGAGLRGRGRRGVKGLTIGIPKEYRVPGMAPEIEALWQQGIEWLKAAGAKIKEVSLPHTKYALPSYYIVAPAEASSNLARYDGVRYGLREKGSRHDLACTRTRARRGFGAEVKRRILIGTYVLSAGYYDAYYLKAQKVRTLIKQRFRPCLRGGRRHPDADHAVGRPSRSARNRGDPVEMYLNDIFTVTVNMAGLPGMSVPAGLSSEGTPLGLAAHRPRLRRGDAVPRRAGDRGGRRAAVQAARLVEQSRMSTQSDEAPVGLLRQPLSSRSSAFRALCALAIIVAVAGTTAGSSGKPVAIGDPAAQTRAILEIIEKALADAGASLKDVVRTRIYLVDIAHWEAVGRVHGEFFGEIRPANSTLQVTGLRQAGMARRDRGRRRYSALG